MLRFNVTNDRYFSTLFAVASMISVGFAGPLLSQSVATPQTLESAELDASPTIVTDGFRSAKFGMDIDAVRSAIAADFGIEESAVQASENAVERTQVLTVAVPDLIPEGGIAQVSYVFGYSSKQLIQVGATWSDKTDPKMTPKLLYDNSNVLRSYFMEQSYALDSVRSNAVLPNGILIFRGADALERATLLLLQGIYATADDGSNVLTPASLDLLYSADPNEPDIFSLPKGNF